MEQLFKQIMQTMANYPVFPLALGCLLIYGVSVCFYATKDALMDRMMNWVEQSEQKERERRRANGEDVPEDEYSCPIHGTHKEDKNHKHSHAPIKKQQPTAAITSTQQSVLKTKKFSEDTQKQYISPKTKPVQSQQSIQPTTRDAIKKELASQKLVLSQGAPQARKSTNNQQQDISKQNQVSKSQQNITKLVIQKSKKPAVEPAKSQQQQQHLQQLSVSQNQVIQSTKQKNSQKKSNPSSSNASTIVNTTTPNNTKKNKGFFIGNMPIQISNTSTGGLTNSTTLEEQMLDAAPSDQIMTYENSCDIAIQCDLGDDVGCSTDDLYLHIQMQKQEQAFLARQQQLLAAAQVNNLPMQQQSMPIIQQNLAQPVSQLKANSRIVTVSSSKKQGKLLSKKDDEWQDDTSGNRRRAPQKKDDGGSDEDDSSDDEQAKQQMKQGFASFGNRNKAKRK